MRHSTLFGHLALTCGLLASPVFAQGKLTLYCSSDEAWCQQAKTEFEKKTGVAVDMTRKSSGETYAQIKAEATNPKGDIWWGGTGDPHLQAAEEGLTQAYVSQARDQLFDWANRQAAASKDRTVGIYSGALGYGYNEELLKKQGLSAPSCWKDLIKPEFKGKVQVANPNSSGTSYTMLATLVQMMGEKEAFDYLRALHKNINQYTKSGSAPIKAAGAGETVIGIVFVHDAVAVAEAGFPIKSVVPCEGTGYEIGSMSIVKGARNIDNARKFYEFALSADFQSKAKDVKSFQVPSNKASSISAKAPDLAKIKLIDYDFVKYGSSAERRRLLKKWDEEIGALPN
ncbi:MAG: ABC transporter substrate-binding protein [Rhodoferax sp.]|nr:ABC transporter substrate-binding protein [Rhodoferax sp.]